MPIRTEDNIGGKTTLHNERKFDGEGIQLITDGDSETCRAPKQTRTTEPRGRNIRAVHGRIVRERDRLTFDIDRHWKQREREEMRTFEMP